MPKLEYQALRQDTNGLLDSCLGKLPRMLGIMVHLAQMFRSQRTCNGAKIRREKPRTEQTARPKGCSALTGNKWIIERLTKTSGSEQYITKSLKML